MSKIILVAETGSDIPPELASKHCIYLVPMHVTFGDISKDDGSFPPEEICDYYERTGQLPKTSGSTPEDFTRVFDTIHAVHPDAHILHLAYSAATTVSYQSAVIASEGRDYVTCLDTKHVSAGQYAIVMAVAEYMEKFPEASPAQVAAVAEDYCRRARMCFMPDDLEYLRAGGRISNVAYYLGGKLLHLHPQVEVLDGKLVATKKYRGSMAKSVEAMIWEYAEKNQLKKDHLWLLHTACSSDSIIRAMELTAKNCGFSSVTWIQAKGVITAHGGPNAFAMAGFLE